MILKMGLSQLGVLLFSFLSIHIASAALYDGTGASVGTELITVRDAYFYRSLVRFRDGESGVLEHERGEALRRTVQKIVFEHMVYLEMKSLQYEMGARSDVGKVISQRKQQAGRANVWKRILEENGRTEAQALDLLSRSAQVDRFLQKKVDTLTPIVTEAETERYYQQNASRFKGGDYAKLKSSIVLLLKKDRMQKGLEEWVRFLKDKYGVNIYLEG